MDDRTGSPTALAAALRSTGYLADDGLATAAFLALRCTARCSARASPAPARPRSRRRSPTVLDAELIRLQCYEGIDASQALYDWDFPRQLLHLRALEATGGRRLHGRRRGLPLRPARSCSPGRSCGRCRPRRAVLLVDEIDRADDEFEAFLLEVLTEHAVSIPELGEVRAEVPPVVVLTSNRTREVHDALKRRCLYLWLDHPDVAREIEILHARIPGLPERLAAEVAAAAHRCARPTCSSLPASRSRSTGRAPCSSSAPATSTSTARPPRSAPSSSTGRTPTACATRLDALLAS